MGLDRQAAKEAFATFLSSGRWSANQIQFVNLVIDYLTEHGAMAPERLYASPYTDFSPRGVEGVFESSDVGRLLAVLDEVRSRALA